MNKKGVEMTLGFVVTAVIILVVLGVILFIFIKGMRSGDDTITDYFDKVDKSTEQEGGPDPSGILGNDWKTSFVGGVCLLFLIRRNEV